MEIDGSVFMNDTNAKSSGMDGNLKNKLLNKRKNTDEREGSE